ncbi:MAG TPA: hypothetical protein VK980_01370 [Sphingomonas sp.]|nr:hypothetical protein [Sphingomonas sp.]
MVRLLLVPLSLLVALPAAAQDAEVTNPCGTGKVACRHIDSIRLQSADGEEQILTANLDFPWVAEGNIILVPGDSVTVRLVPDGAEFTPVLVRFGPASAATKPGPGEIRFTVQPSDHGKQVMVAESNYPGMIDYGALIATVRGGPERTSVCTLEPGKPVYEMWQDPIYQFALMHFVATTEPGCKTLHWGQEPVLVRNPD